MVKESRDTAKLLVQPWVLFLACLGLGYLLQQVLPVQGFAWTGWLRIGVSCGLLLLCNIFAGFSILVLKKHKTSLDPLEPTVSVVTGGPYRFSRNPLYIAMLLCFSGFAVILNSWWMYGLIPVLFVFLDLGLVRPEEKFLSRKFGADYDTYRKRVRRWM